MLFFMLYMQVKVQYIDFGNSEEVNPKDLVELPEELTMPKPFAMKIMFHNVRYIHSKEKEATAFLKEVTEGNYVTVTPTFRLPDGSGQFAHLSIGGLNLNQELVERGLGMQAAGRGGQPGKAPLLGEAPSKGPQPVYSDLKIELKNKSRALEKASKEKEIAEKLREDSITTLPPVMTALGNYRTQQQRICQFKDQPVPEDEIQARDQLRKELFECLTDCIKEMEQKPFTSRAQSITQCIEKLHSHYDNFFNMPVQQFPDLQSVVEQYEEFKQLSLSSSIQREGVDMDLGNQLRQYCVCLQQEMACKNVEGSGDAAFIASLVKTVHHDLKSEVLCANNFIRLQADFCEMRKNMEGWLDKKPSADKLIANRSTLKALKSKLRHRLADKHDAEENNDDEELNEIKKDIVAIQQEIHAALQVEDEELSELAMMIDSHFPELLNLHPDCGLDIHLAYNGLVKPSHAVDHYDLKPVPGSTGRLFYSTFAGKPVIVIECLLSDSHHLGRDEFLGQLTNYTNITHPALLRPSAVFFDKNNRHAYLQIEKEGDILANYVEYENLPKQADRAKCKYTSPNNLEFMAPEMLNMTAGMEPTGTVDMYCVGILLLWLACPTDPINYNPDGSLDVNQFQLVSLNQLLSEMNFRIINVSFI
nr:hypothetical protein BaRGS_000143 [Batillaria attramentaria]